MPAFPFALRWEIPENELIPLKNSINGGLLSSWISGIPGITYSLVIFPNGLNDEQRGKAWIFLHLDLGDPEKVKADYTFTIDSANYSFKNYDNYEKSIAWGTQIADTEEFFNPDKKFIVDGKCIIKAFGTLKYENEDSIPEQQKWEFGDLGDNLWKNNDSKDFTIIVDDEEIKVHKLILGSQSEVFSAMLKSNMKESIENKVYITDFTFNVVETAVKMIYNCNCVTFLSIDENIKLLQFFDKYNIPALKDKVESFLIDKISVDNVCRLTNASILSNSTKLKNKCMEFLENSFSSKTPLSDIQILDKDVAVEILQNLVLQNVKIR